MKAKLLRDDLTVLNPEHDPDERDARNRQAKDLVDRANAIVRRCKKRQKRPTPKEVDTVVKLLRTADQLVYRVPVDVPAERGQVIEHWDAPKLVRMGVAEPEDRECTAAAKTSDALLDAAIRAYERAARGIHPDEFEAYDAGLMNGYDAEGRPTKDGVVVEELLHDDDAADDAAE